MLGNEVGGGGVHWNAETFRFLPSAVLAGSRERIVLDPRA
jgi:hypothetical protein